MLAACAVHTARQFARAIIMPNLVPPVVTLDDAVAYRDRILAALPHGMTFEPLMTLYLTEGTDPADVAAAHAGGITGAEDCAHGGAGDQGGLDAQFVEDLEHRDMREAACAPCPEGEANGRIGLHGC